MGKTRDSANLVSDNNIFVDIANDRVGIGTTIPGYDLDVSGSINLSGNLYQNGSLFSGGGGSITVQDEGSNIGTAATTFNFVGSGVGASYSSGIATITISGGGGGGINPAIAGMIF